MDETVLDISQEKTWNKTQIAEICSENLSYSSKQVFKTRRFKNVQKAYTRNIVHGLYNLFTPDTTTPEILRQQTSYKNILDVRNEIIK